MDAVTYVILIIIAAAALVLLYASGMLRSGAQVLLAAALIAGAFVIRGLCMSHVTLDYEDFLSRWVAFYRENGGFAALGQKIGNYNLPYLYFLCLFSYIGIDDLVLIKSLSIVFDVVLAWAAMKLAGQCTGSRAKAMAAFFLVLYLPTVVLNGAYWAQCDSIYVAFAVLALYLALSGRGAAGMVCMAVSFAFKLQAVFVMPVFVVLLIAKKVKLWHFLLFPLSYVVLMLPAVLSGYPLLDTITLYFDQMGTVGSALNYNSSSIYAFASDVANEQLASTLGIFAAFLLMAAVFAWAYTRRRSLSDSAILGLALLLAVGIPYLLPHMHERYFFAADILSLLVAVTAPEYMVIAGLTQFASLLGYHAYLKMRYLLPMSYGAAAFVLVLAGAALYTATRMCSHGRRKNC